VQTTNHVPHSFRLRRALCADFVLRLFSSLDAAIAMLPAMCLVLVASTGEEC
jgi:hypothetical protein